MIETGSVHAGLSPDRRRLWLAAAFLLAVVGLGIWLAWRTPFFASLGRQFTSPAALEARYGLRVNLLAVTAAGGMVDLRVKILDAEKARLLLADPELRPALVVEGTQAVLELSGDFLEQPLALKDGGSLFWMFSNTRGVVRPGSRVSIRLGDVLVGPIEAK